VGAIRDSVRVLSGSRRCVRVCLRRCVSSFRLRPVCVGAVRLRPVCLGGPTDFTQTDIRRFNRRKSPSSL